MKSILSVLLSICILAFACAFAACSGAGEHTHVWNEGEVTTEPTCVKEGVMTYTCTVSGCGATRTETIGVTEHSWDEGEVTTESTCAKEGIKTYTCAVCGTTYTEAVEKLAHSWGEGTVSGDKITYTCTECGAEKSEDYTSDGDNDNDNNDDSDNNNDNDNNDDSDNNDDNNDNSDSDDNNNSDDDEVTYTKVAAVAATCSATGNIEYYSGSDGKCYTYSDGSYTEISCADTVLAKAEHTAAEAVTENEVSATCSAAGSYQSVVYCSVCGEVLSRETVTVSATGHSYDEGVVTKEPSLGVEGEKTFTCSKCEDYYTETIAAKNYASYTEEFTIDNQDGCWQYGLASYSWAEAEGVDGTVSESFTFTQATDKNEGVDGWIADNDNVEIKAGWINAGSYTTIAYKNNSGETVTVTLNLIFTGSTENTRLAVRIGIKNSEGKLYSTPSFNSNSDRKTLTVTGTYTLNAGDTIYFIFSNEGKEEGAYPNGDLTITLTKVDEDGSDDSAAGVSLTSTVQKDTLKCYSIVKDENGDIEAEAFGVTYTFSEKLQSGYSFFAGGYASWDDTDTAATINGDTSLTLVNIVPGDMVTFEITVENTSTVDIEYCISLVYAEDNVLLQAFVVTAVVDEVDIINNYTVWSAPADGGSETKTILVTILLPAQYEDQSVHEIYMTLDLIARAYDDSEQETE